MKVCDRCGEKITDKEPKFSKLEDWCESILVGMILGDVDLCKKCSKDFIKTFYPKIKSLRKELEDWIKQGGG